MTTQFVPLTAKLIDEGQFLNDLDEELGDLQQVLRKYVRQFRDKADGAKAKLTLDIELKCECPDDDGFSIKTSMKAVHPKRPASVSIAVGGEDEQGKLALFVRKSGSDDNHPSQLKLSTRDGRNIDESGEADG